MRQIVLDTETTGLETSQGHRIIEIGCVELMNRRLTGRHYHQYINPEREVDAGAFQVHGISNEMLADKPVFAQIADEFLAFVGDADLIIHNAAFDIGFLNYEISLLPANPVYSGEIDPLLLTGGMETRCSVIDSLIMARSKHPGQKNNLDALCKRYGVDNSQRELHGALLDAEILADVYLLMTGGQTALSLGGTQSNNRESSGGESDIRRLMREPKAVLQATAEELESHEKKLAAIDKQSGGKCVWLANA